MSSRAQGRLRDRERDAKGRLLPRTKTTSSSDDHQEVEENLDLGSPPSSVPTSFDTTPQLSPQLPSFHTPPSTPARPPGRPSPQRAPPASAPALVTPPVDSDDDMPSTAQEDFTGRETQVPPPWTWLRQLEQTFRRDWDDAWKVKTLRDRIQEDSPAEDWFESLDDATKAKWDEVVKSFNAKWPKTKTALSTDEAISRLEEADMRLPPEKLGKTERYGDREIASHVAWAIRMEEWASKNGVPQHVATTARRLLPAVLKTKIKLTKETWAELVTRMKEVTARELEEALEVTNEAVKSVREAAKAAAPPREEPATPTRALRAGLVRMSVGTPRAPMPMTPRRPGESPFLTTAPPAPGNLFYPYAAPATPTAPSRSPADRLQAMRDNAIVQHPDTADGRRAYQQQKDEWDRKHAGQRPDERRPYPLTPGTEAAGTGECWRCGRRGHQRADCPPATTAVPTLEQDWRRIASSIKRPRAPNANPAAAVRPVYLAMDPYSPYAPSHEQVFWVDTTTG